ncbi:MAG: fibronectin type III domain-containing protein [Verrucomicrobiales bacterium]|nr:fibronectin type III domain-containing protein [Verrucomicrobiales bacterium]
MKNISEQKAGRTNAVSAWASRITGLTSALAGILFCALLYNPAPSFGATLPAPYSLTLAWNPNPAPDVAGYRVYYGTASGDYTNSVAAGNVTTLTVPGLLSGVIYYFAITAVGTNGLASDFSNEISYPQALSGAFMQITAVAGGQFMLTVTGLAGHTNNIEATQDLKTWTVIGTVTIGAGGSVNFTDTNAANFQNRFYRTRDTQP